MLILINSDWCSLVLIDTNWCWIIRVDADWCLLMPIDANSFWLMLIVSRSRMEATAFLVSLTNSPDSYHTCTRCFPVAPLKEKVTSHKKVHIPFNQRHHLLAPLSGALVVGAVSDISSHPSNPISTKQWPDVWIRPDQTARLLEIMMATPNICKSEPVRSQNAQGATKLRSHRAG